MAKKKGESAAVTVVTIILALGFIWMGPVGFLRPEPVARLYISLGYPGWTHLVVSPLVMFGGGPALPVQMLDRSADSIDCRGRHRRLVSLASCLF